MWESTITANEDWIQKTVWNTSIDVTNAANIKP